VTYTTKYNLVSHLRAHHNVIVELDKPRCPSIREKGPRHQDHAVMNVQVLSNPLARFHHNKKKATMRAKEHTNLEWDRLQVAMGDT
jgi:hypothetical protein